MATKVQAPQLTPNNRIYLYQLLSRELGCGKQTFMPAVEEALAGDRMTADDLGFESTRALLEALEEFVKLTVFKGGRIYATVMVQPAWDEALAALESGKAKDAGGPSNKPWKRKKADKTLKPVRPKRVKRPEPAPEPEQIAKSEAAESSVLHGAAAQARAEETEAASEHTDADTANIPEDAPATEAVEAVEVVETTGMHEEAPRTEHDDARDCAEEDPQPSPAISLTVTYDPYSGIDRERKLASPIPSRPSPIRRLWSPQAPHHSSPRTRRPSPRRPHPCRPQFSPRIPPTSQPRSTSPANSSPPCASCSPTARTSSRSSLRTTHAPAPSNSSPARGHARPSPCASSTPTQSSRSASPSRSAGAPAFNGSCSPSNRRDFSKASSSSLAHQRKSASHPN